MKYPSLLFLLIVIYCYIYFYFIHCYIIIYYFIDFSFILVCFARFTLEPNECGSSTKLSFVSLKITVFSQFH